MRCGVAPRVWVQRCAWECAGCMACRAHSTADIATHRRPQAQVVALCRSLACAARRCPAWCGSGGRRRGTKPPTPPKPHAPRRCCRGVRSPVRCTGAGRAEAHQCRVAGWQGGRPAESRRVAGPQCVGSAFLSRTARQGRRAGSTEAGLRGGVWRACADPCGGGRESAQRSGVAAVPVAVAVAVAVAVLCLRPPGRRWWRGVPPWRCRRAGRGC